MMWPIITTIVELINLYIEQNRGLGVLVAFKEKIAAL
jgi:hypothetical protein